MAHLSVVIPVYKAESCLQELYRRLKLSLKTVTPNYEIVFVEDGGGDESWNIISDLARKDRRVKGLQLSRNFGQHAAITAGLDHTNSDWTVVMDCDLQDQPEEIPKMYQKANEGYEIVVARRGKRKDTFWKRGASWLFFIFFNYLSGMKYDSEVGNFRIVSKKVVLAFRTMGEKFRFFSGMIDWIGFKRASVDVQHGKRFRGETTYTYWKLFELAFDAILSYSDKPLWISIKIGFAMSFLSAMIGFYLIYREIFQGISVVGWASLIVSIYFIGGITIGIIGIVGIYVGKTFDETKQRPLYVISESRNV
jgi:dolichol-phosphate mannosyltransferase